VNNKTLFVALLLGLLLLAACAPAAVEEPGSQAAAEGDAVEVLVYSSPT
jgi:hypothetical protein